MRHAILLGLVTAGILAFPGTGQAQLRPKLKIDKVQVGIPVNQVQAEFKTGAWTPVYVDITAGPEPIVKGEVHVESVDTDDVRNVYKVPLPPLEGNEATRVLTFTKPGSLNSEIVVTVQLDRHQYISKENYTSMQLGHQLVVMAGGRSQAIRRAFAATQAKQPDENDIFDTGSHRFAFLDDVKAMPTRWFGYEPVDLLVLTTGNREFVTALLADKDRREALAEWVRRGGRLVISTGRNQDVLALMDTTLQFLPATVSGSMQVPQINMGMMAPIESRILVNTPPRTTPGAAAPPIEIAKLEPKTGREFQRIVPEDPKPTEPLLVIRGAYGTGQIGLIALDLDLPPFTTWKGQVTSWRRVVDEFEPKQPAVAAGNVQQPWQVQQSEDLASQLEKNLEMFQDVPVISFGWVALFILIYIIIVGPLDYLFLKKVVKRLELTWITFPTVVITISVASYFIAYYLKGDDQLINKVDFVDVDLQGQQVYGRTWFTIFSPRIQHYTVGVEPAEPTWAPSGVDAKNQTSVMVSWLGRPEMGWAGVGRAQSQSLFRRTYEYAPDATGLRGVPIQVWTTKSFMADWQTPMDPARPLVQTGDLKVAGPDTLAGTITSNLPVELDDVAVFYRKNVYSMDKLMPGVPKRIENVVGRQNTMQMNQWLSSAPQDPGQRPPQPGRPNPTMGSLNSYLTIKQLAFYDVSAAGNKRNQALRAMDETWRLGNKDELILFGRVSTKEGGAEDVTASPTSPSRLWLGALPRSGQARPPVQGSLKQETYVRVFVPVKNN